MKAVIAVLCAAAGCGGRAAPNEPPRLDVRAVDRSADPCNDFYAYACGNWLRANPIPATETRSSRFTALEDEDLAHVRALVDAATQHARTPSERRVGAYYAACMDRAAIDARGLAPIGELLRRIDAIAVPSDAAAVLGDLHRRALRGLFDMYVVPDPRDVRRTIADLDVGALGMGSPESYTRDDEAAAKLRDRYREHVGRVLAMLGDRDTGDAARVVALETSLARALPDAAERRNDADQIHVMTIEDLARIAPAIAWPSYLRELGAPALEHANVLFVPYLQAVATAIVGDLPGVRAYLRYQVARRFAAVLPTALDDEIFDFAGRIARGAREQAPRSERCLDLLDRDLRDDVGRMFAAAYLPRATRDRATVLVARVTAALRRELPTLPWLGPAARAAAVAKLDNMRFAIGQPARWRTYDDVAVRADDPVGNIEHALAAATRFDLAKLGQPTDRDEMFEPAQSDSGYGVKSEVSVGFAAGFLQPPVLASRADDAVDFGGLGGVIGHEITHHFDDVGRRYDVHGNIAPWWSDNDVAHYQEIATCFVDEYAQFHIADGTPVDGRLTLGENLADNGGLRLAWEAFGSEQHGVAIDGFTPAQRFFLGWAQLRCESVTLEAARAQAHSDPHAPGQARVDGVVRNLPEFATAFGCKAGAAMAPVQRCRLW